MEDSRYSKQRFMCLYVVKVRQNKLTDTSAWHFIDSIVLSAILGK